MNVSSPAPLRAPRVHLHLFGSFESTLDNEPIHFPTRKIEALLAFLVLHPEPHPREKLAALFWGDVSDNQARVSLRYALARLRETLGGDFLIADRETVQLNPDFPIWVDACEFRVQDSTFRVQNYRGDLLADFYGDWIGPERERFRQGYLDAALQLTQHYRSTSEYARAVETAQRVLECDPANERAHQHLIFCFVAQGDRPAALRQYEQCVHALQRDLAIDPAPETKALYEWIKQTRSQLSSPAARITNLPIPLTSFIGREQEMVEVKRLLSLGNIPASDAVGARLKDDDSRIHPSAAQTLFGTRLLTLTGAGGCGKTRLAIQAATDLIDAFRDGVWWVELAPLADGALVPLAAAKALGVRELPPQPLLESLVNFLREKRLLLVMDNCEHLLDACAQLARTLLGECANLQILATSRERLDFIGETVQAVSTLAFPDPNALSVTELLLQFAAVRLFVARAAAVNAHFALNAQTASAVTQICARLDGIPLALELAAARAKDLDVEGIAARLEDRFDFLTRGNRGALPRQQTLRALIDWSYDLLTTAEQTLLRRAAVFAGGWTLEAALAVGAGDGIAAGEVFDLLGRLIDKSLVQVDTLAASGGAWYRLLETIRQYALAKLAASGEADAVRRRHAAYYLTLYERNDVGMSIYSRLPSARFELHEMELDNLRAALTWSQSPLGNAELGLRLSMAVPSWLFGYAEARGWLEGALTRADAQRATYPKLRAEALASLGLLSTLDDYSSAQAHLAQSLMLFQQLGDSLSSAWVLERLGVVAREQGDAATARLRLAESLALYRELGHTPGIAWGLVGLGEVAVMQEEAQTARGLLNEALTLFRELEHIQGIGWSLNHLGHVAQLQGEYELARQLHEESLPLFREIHHDFPGVGEANQALGETALAQGDAPLATRHFREALGLFRFHGGRAHFAWCLAGLAGVAVLDKESQRAACLWGAAEALRLSIGAREAPASHATHERLMAATREQLGEAAFAEAWAKGQAMTMEQAIELALSA